MSAGKNPVIADPATINFKSDYYPKGEWQVARRAARAAWKGSK